MVAVILVVLLAAATVAQVAIAAGTNGILLFVVVRSRILDSVGRRLRQRWSSTGMTDSTRIGQIIIKITRTAIGKQTRFLVVGMAVAVGVHASNGGGDWGWRSCWIERWCDGDNKRCW